MKELLFNPFRRIAGGKALSIGWVIMLATALLAYLGTCHFDGIIDAHIGEERPIYVYFLEALINWLLLALVFFIAAKIISQSAIRWIDFAGTVALSRYPYFFVALIALSMPKIDMESLVHVENMESIDFGQIGLLIVLGLLTALCIIWYIALLWNGFKISSNGKGSKAVWAFIVALLTSEVVSLIIYHVLF